MVRRNVRNARYFLLGDSTEGLGSIRVPRVLFGVSPNKQPPQFERSFDGMYRAPREKWQRLDDVSSPGIPPRRLQTIIPLQMSDFRGRRLVIVMRAVEVSYRRIDELIDIHAIQAIDPNCIEFSAQAGIFSPPEGADSAVPTKYMVDVVGLVINKLCFPR